MIRVNDTITIADKDVEERFVRAMGPGGQNIRLEEIAVQLRYNVKRSSLPPDMKRRLVGLAGRHVSASGVLVIDSRVHRSQAKNRAAARRRFLALLQRAAKAPAIRRKTVPLPIEREARLTEKRRRAAVKVRRSRPQEE